MSQSGRIESFVLERSRPAPQIHPVGSPRQGRAGSRSVAARADCARWGPAARSIDSVFTFIVSGKLLLE
jgi:hypothetical protein